LGREMFINSELGRA